VPGGRCVVAFFSAFIILLIPLQHKHFKIDTNNFVESWHAVLKMHYLGLMRQQRADYLIYVLATQVEPDFRQDSMRSSLGLQKMRFSKDERAAQKKAEEIQWEEATMMVEEIDEHTVCTKLLPIDLFLTVCSDPSPIVFQR
jgi:hypothetical protein